MGKKDEQRLTLQGFPVEGSSIGGDGTCIVFPSLNLTFDIGCWPQRVLSQDFVFVSHVHRDHIDALYKHVATRELRNMKPPTIIVPSASTEYIKGLFELHRKAVGKSLKHTLIGLDIGEDFCISKDLKVRAFKTYHVIQSQGYVVYSVRQKLKQEYLQLSPKEIKNLRASGVETVNMTTTPEIAFTGDTMSDFIIDETNVDVLKAKVLVVESTYVDGLKTVEDAREHGHIHLSEIVKYSEKLENKAILLIHFSRRYSVEDIERAVSLLPPPLKDRVFALTEGFHREPQKYRSTRQP